LISSRILSVRFFEKSLPNNPSDEPVNKIKPLECFSKSSISQ